MQHYTRTTIFFAAVLGFLTGQAQPAEPQLLRLTSSYHSKFFLSYTADGSRLTYTRHHPNRRGAGQVLMGLRIVDADGGNDRPLLSAFDADVQIQEHAAWSPDGKQLAITGGGNDLGNAAKDLFVADIDNFTARNLRKVVPGAGSMVGEQPSWSPDGKQLVVTTPAPGLWLIDADGKNRRKFIHPPGRYVHQPAWSPDGDWIAFASDRDGNSEIYVVRPDGTDLARVTYHPAIDCRPKWSPDGQWLAFTSNRDGNNEIYVVRPDGSGLRNLTSHPDNDDHAAWSPDGRHLAFISMRGGGGFDIYRMNVPADLQVSSRPKVRTRAVAAERPDGLVAHYDFEEGRGEATRDRAGTSHAILAGATWARDRGGNVLVFDGKASVNCGNHTRLQIAGPLTIMLWVKIQSGSQNHYLVSKNGWNIYVGPDGVARFETRTAADTAWDTLSAAQPLKEKEWNAIAAVFDPKEGNLALYINGKLSATRERKDGAIGGVAAYNLELGHYGPSKSQNLIGALGRLRIYKRALTAAEIAKQYEDDGKKAK